MNSESSDSRRNRQSGELDATQDASRALPGDTTLPSGRQQESGGDMPARLNRYELIREIGRGSFGQVFLGRDPTLDRQVAIKIPRAVNWSLEEVQEFLREAKYLAQLQHANIVSIYDAGTTKKGLPFLVMEFIDGRPLSRIPIDASSRSDRLEWLAQVADAIHFAHKKGFVHRDLKPDNILISRDGTAKVSDFGLAINDQDRIKNQYAGTPSYMSPEQVQRQSDSLDGRTDIWSLGIIIYEQLTGSHPFRARNKEDLFDQILHRSVKPPSQFDESINSDLESICMRCLEKDVSQRPMNAREVKLGLLHAARNRPRKHVTKTLTATALLLIVFLSVWLANQLRPDQPLGETAAPSQASQTDQEAMGAELKPLAWATTQAGDYYRMDDDGRIHILSTSDLSCFETHRPQTSDYQLSASVEYGNRRGYAGFALNIHQTSVSPIEYNCLLVRAGSLLQDGSISLVVEDGRLAMNSVRHMDFFSEKTYCRLPTGAKFDEDLLIKADVANNRLIGVTINGQPVEGLDLDEEVFPIHENTGCGVLGLSRITYHALSLERFSD